MQIDDSDDSLPSKDPLIDDFVPWTAADMSPSTKLRCRGCENVVLDMPRCADGSENTGPAGWTWKDLPSGNWAEMMDFWHCHKPDPPEGHGHGEDPNAQTKGYGAANQVVATAGTVLVDVATFLVSEVDCRGLKKVRLVSALVSAILSLYLRAKRRRPFRFHGRVSDTIALY
jgi:hypothetical protein